MKYGGLLTQVEKKETFSVCDVCETIYQDDANPFGTVRCPNCPTIALRRGLTREEARELLDDSHKELLS